MPERRDQHFLGGSGVFYLGRWLTPAIRKHAKQNAKKLPPHSIAPEVVELSAAHAWRLTPAQWRAQTPDDRARMMAHVQFEAAYQNWAQDTLSASSAPPGKPGIPERAPHPLFAAMQDRLRRPASKGKG